MNITKEQINEIMNQIDSGLLSIDVAEMEFNCADEVKIMCSNCSIKRWCHAGLDAYETQTELIQFLFPELTL